MTQMPWAVVESQILQTCDQQEYMASFRPNMTEIKWEIHATT